MAAAKLDSLYQIMQKLTPASSTEDYSAFGAFFDENCTVYLRSMREWEEPNIGRQAVIDALKENLAVIHIDERRVLSHSVSPDGSTLFCETKNRLNVLGDILDPFFETAVVVFNDNGLIVDFKLYSCRSHIVGILQSKTGVGPYTNETMKMMHAVEPLVDEK